MGTIERMVVLANSRKMGGCCVAGRSLDGKTNPGRWLRPVGSQVAAGLPQGRTRCADGSAAAVLDLVDIDLDQPVPHLHQRENRLLGNSPWKRCGRIGWDRLAGLVDTDESGLWVDGYSSSCGSSDRVPETFLAQVTGSLRLIRTGSLHLFRDVGASGQKQLRGAFSHAGRNYVLAVTDPAAWALLGCHGELALADAYLCISLGVPFKGYAYKLMASVITEHRAKAAA